MKNHMVFYTVLLLLKSTQMTTTQKYEVQSRVVGCTILFPSQVPCVAKVCDVESYGVTSVEVYIGDRQCQENGLEETLQYVLQQFSNVTVSLVAISDVPLQDLASLQVLQSVQLDGMFKLSVTNVHVPVLSITAHLNDVFELDLSNNGITTLTRQFFLSIPNTRILILKDNKIRHIGPDIWLAISETELLVIDLSYNLLSYIDRVALYTVATNTINVDLSDNKIIGTSNELGTTNHSVCNLSPRKTPIKLITVSHIEMSIIEVFEGWGYDRQQTECWIKAGIFEMLDSQNNWYDLPSCDCRDCFIYQLALIDLIPLPKINCRPNGKRVSTSSLTCSDLKHMTCPLEEGCSLGFKCKWSSCDDTIVIENDKTFSNIREMPNKLPDEQEEKWSYEIIIDQADKMVLQEHTYWNRTRILNITNSKVNHIKEEVFESLRNTVEIIDLSGNELSKLPKVKEYSWSKLKDLRLDGNQWHCDCHMRWIKKWLIDFSKDKDKVLCQTPFYLSGRTIVSVDDASLLCASDIAGMVIGGTSFILLFMTTIIIWKRRFWFYVRFELHPFDRDECVNEDKRFDVFVSYSNDDSDWARDLIRELQAENYRICFHELDFLSGTSIPDNITRAVHFSKRTLCLVSHNFVKSAYCRYEFDMARSFDMCYNKKRLIVVMFDDVAREDLPDDIKIYVKNYTYLKRNCALFRQRLRYQLAQNKLGEVEYDQVPLLAELPVP